MNKNIAKKIGIGLGSLVALFLVIAIVVPLVVDVDKYRPQIVEAANEHINGKLALGKLKLSLWGRVLIDIDGLTLTDSKGTEVVSVKETYFHLPFLSLLSGSPQVIFKMDEPEVVVIKDKNGKLNLMGLAKTSLQTAPSSTPSTAPQTNAPADQKPASVPGIVAAARLSVELKEAHIVYNDLATGLKNDVKLNVRLKDLSMSRPVDLEVWADLKTTMGKTMEVVGPARMEGKFSPDFKDGVFRSLAASLLVNLDKLEIKMPGTFEKGPNIPANMKVELDATPEVMTLKTAQLTFHNAVIQSKGTVTNLGKETSPVVDLTVNSNAIEMGPWAALLPSMKEFELGGSVGLKAAASGPTDKLKYNATVAIDKVSAKAPMMKAKPVIDGKIAIETDQVRDLAIVVTAPGSDLRFKGSVVSFSKPDLKLIIESKGLDLDQLIDFPKPAKSEEKSAEQAATGSSDGKADPKKSDSMEKTLEPLRKNPALAAAKGDIKVDLKSIKAYGVVISNFETRFKLNRLVAEIEKFGMKVFDGSIAATGSTNLNKSPVPYQFSASVTGLDLKKAVTSQLELFKNTLLGQFNLTVKGSGTTIEPSQVLSNVNVQGTLKVDDAKFASVDVGKMTTEAINKGISEVSKKFPNLQGKQIKGLPSGSSEYEVITSNFSMKDGQFTAPDFFAKSRVKKGVDLKGNTAVDLIKQELGAKWEVIDTHNMTGAYDLSPPIAGKTVDHILARKGSPVSFPVTVGCKLSSPCYSYNEVPGHFASVAAANVAGAATEKAKEEVQKKVLEKAPAPVKQILKKFKF